MKHLLHFIDYVQGQIGIFSFKPFPTTAGYENAFDSDFGRQRPFYHLAGQLYKSVNSKKAEPKKPKK